MNLCGLGRSRAGRACSAARWWGCSSPHHYGIRPTRRFPATIFFFWLRSLFRSPCWRFALRLFEEAKVILIFHIVGTLMELFKTAVGSWIYPEAAFFRIVALPFFSRFIYPSLSYYFPTSSLC